MKKLNLRPFLSEGYFTDILFENMNYRIYRNMWTYLEKEIRIVIFPISIKLWKKYE